MKPNRLLRLLPALLACSLLTVSCSQRDDDDDAATGDDSGEDGGDTGDGTISTADCLADPTAEIEGDTIKLVSSFPQSGLTAAFAEIAKGWRSYFEMINEQGGVEIAGKTYQIETEDRDDEYDAAKTASNIEEMVGSDGDKAFAAFNVIGTANNVAVRDFLGELCVPDLFAATGSPAWGNPDYPWLIGGTLVPYSLEGVVFADLLKQENPDAKVAMLVQNDDFGAAYEEGFKQAIEGTDIEVVKVERYNVGASEVAAQITSLASSGADTFFNGATLLACPDALGKANEAGWEREITWVSGTCISKTLMGLAQDNADGVYSLSNVKDPQDPQYASDEAMTLYKETVEKFEPGTDTENGIVAFGWTQGALLVEALKQADAPTRLAVMESVRDLDLGDEFGLLAAGTGVVTGEEDLFMGERMNLVRYKFDGDNSFFELVGDVYDFEGETAELTPSDLING